LGYCSKLGVVVNLPVTVARVDRNPMMTMEAIGLRPIVVHHL
jgi:hypothetical protein